MPLVSRVYSFVATFISSMILPTTDLSVSGIGWSHILKSIWETICYGLYSICKWFLAFMDFLQYFIQKLIGLDYWLDANLDGKRSLGDATSEDMIFKFLYADSVQKVFRALCALFIVLLIVFTIFQIIKSEWDFMTGDGKNGNSKNAIFRSSFKAILLVIIFPIVLVMGIVSSNAILASIIKAVGVDMAETFGGKIFAISAQPANKYRHYVDTGTYLPTSDQVTFYLDDSNKVIYLGSEENNNQFRQYYSSYKEYLSKTAKARKLTMNSIFDPLIPKNEENFSGYCFQVKDDDGNTKIYFVKAESAEKDKYYYYLVGVLGANVYGDKINDGDFNSTLDEETLEALEEDVGGSKKGLGYIQNLDLSEARSVTRSLCRNSWNYSLIYVSPNKKLSQTLAGTGNQSRNDFELGSGVGMILHNSDHISGYFDGGQFGVVQSKAEYTVMADVIDFMCDNGLTFYIMDATSPLIQWNYKGYHIDSSLVSSSLSGISSTADGGGTSVKLTESKLTTFTDNTVTETDKIVKGLAFITQYANNNTLPAENEQDVIYVAKYNAKSEIDGARFIICLSDGKDYYPLVNGREFKVGDREYMFKSSIYDKDYHGVVWAKGTFDTSTVDGARGNPTYLKNTSTYSGETEVIVDADGSYYYKFHDDALGKRISFYTHYTQVISGDSYAYNPTGTGNFYKGKTTTTPSGNTTDKTLTVNGIKYNLIETGRTRNGMKEYATESKGICYVVYDNGSTTYQQLNGNGSISGIGNTLRPCYLTSSGVTVLGEDLAIKSVAYTNLHYGEDADNTLKSSFSIFDDKGETDENGDPVYDYLGTFVKSSVDKKIDSIVDINDDTKSFKPNWGGEYFSLNAVGKADSEDEIKEKFGAITTSDSVSCVRNQIERFSGSSLFDYIVEVNIQLFKGIWEIKTGCVKQVSDSPSVQRGNTFTFSGTGAGITFDYFFDQNVGLKTFYAASKINYPLLFVASILIIKVLFTSLWGVIKRFYMITLYYLAMPVAASTLPIDGGSRFGNVRNQITQEVLSTYGVLIGLNLFFVLLSPIDEISRTIFTDEAIANSGSYFLIKLSAWLSARVLNELVYILFLLVAFTLINELPQVVSNLSGGKDLKASGEQTMGAAKGALKAAKNVTSGGFIKDMAKDVKDTVPLVGGAEAAVKGGIKFAGQMVDKAKEGYDKIKKGKGEGDGEGGDNEAKQGEKKNSRQGEDNESDKEKDKGGENEETKSTMENARQAGDDESDKKKNPLNDDLDESEEIVEGQEEKDKNEADENLEAEEQKLVEDLENTITEEEKNKNAEAEKDKDQEPKKRGLLDDIKDAADDQVGFAKKVGGGIANAGKWVGKKASFLANKVKDKVIKPSAKALKSAGKWAAKPFVTVGRWVATNTAKVYNKTKDAVGKAAQGAVNLGKTIAQPFVKVGTAVKDFVVEGAKNVQTFVGNAYDKVKDRAVGLYQTGKKFVQTSATTAAVYAKKFASPFVKFGGKVKETTTGVINKTKKFVKAIPANTNAFLNKHQGLKKVVVHTAAAGYNIYRGSKKVYEGASWLGKKVSKKVKPYTDKAAGYIKETRFGKAVVRARDNAKTKVQSSVDNAKQFISRVPIVSRLVKNDDDMSDKEKEARGKYNTANTNFTKKRKIRKLAQRELFNNKVAQRELELEEKKLVGQLDYSEQKQGETKSEYEMRQKKNEKLEKDISAVRTKKADVAKEQGAKEQAVVSARKAEKEARNERDDAKKVVEDSIEKKEPPIKRKKRTSPIDKGRKSDEEDSSATTENARSSDRVTPVKATLSKVGKGMKVASLVAGAAALSVTPLGLVGTGLVYGTAYLTKKAVTTGVNFAKADKETRIQMVKKMGGTALKVAGVASIGFISGAPVAAVAAGNILLYDKIKAIRAKNNKKVAQNAGLATGSKKSSGDNESQSVSVTAPQTVQQTQNAFVYDESKIAEIVRKVLRGEEMFVSQADRTKAAAHMVNYASINDQKFIPNQNEAYRNAIVNSIGGTRANVVAGDAISNYAASANVSLNQVMFNGFKDAEGNQKAGLISADAKLAIYKSVMNGEQLDNLKGREGQSAEEILKFIEDKSDKGLGLGLDVVQGKKGISFEYTSREGGKKKVKENDATNAAIKEALTSGEISNAAVVDSIEKTGNLDKATQAIANNYALTIDYNKEETGKASNDYHQEVFERARKDEDINAEAILMYLQNNKDKLKAFNSEYHYNENSNPEEMLESIKSGVRNGVKGTVLGDLNPDAYAKELSAAVSKHVGDDSFNVQAFDMLPKAEQMKLTGHITANMEAASTGVTYAYTDEEKLTKLAISKMKFGDAEFVNTFLNSNLDGKDQVVNGLVGQYYGFENANSAEGKKLLAEINANADLKAKAESLANEQHRSENDILMGYAKAKLIGKENEFDQFVGNTSADRQAVETIMRDGKIVPEVVDITQLSDEKFVSAVLEQKEGKTAETVNQMVMDSVGIKLDGDGKIDMAGGSGYEKLVDEITSSASQKWQDKLNATGDYTSEDAQKIVLGYAKAKIMGGEGDTKIDSYINPSVEMDKSVAMKIAEFDPVKEFDQTMNALELYGNLDDSDVRDFEEAFKLKTEMYDSVKAAFGYKEGGDKAANRAAENAAGKYIKSDGKNRNVLEMAGLGLSKDAIENNLKEVDETYFKINVKTGLPFSHDILDRTDAVDSDPNEKARLEKLFEMKKQGLTKKVLEKKADELAGSVDFVESNGSAIDKLKERYLAGKEDVSDLNAKILGNFRAANIASYLKEILPAEEVESLIKDGSESGYYTLSQAEQNALLARTAVADQGARIVLSNNNVDMNSMMQISQFLNSELGEALKERLIAKISQEITALDLFANRLGVNNAGVYTLVQKQTEKSYDAVHFEKNQGPLISMETVKESAEKAENGKKVQVVADNITERMQVLTSKERTDIENEAIYKKLIDKNSNYIDRSYLMSVVDSEKVRNAGEKAKKEAEAAGLDAAAQKAAAERAMQNAVIKYVSEIDANKSIINNLRTREGKKAYLDANAKAIAGNGLERQSAVAKAVWADVELQKIATKIYGKHGTLKNENELDRNSFIMQHLAEILEKAENERSVKEVNDILASGKLLVSENATAGNIIKNLSQEQFETVVKGMKNQGDKVVSEIRQEIIEERVKAGGLTEIPDTTKMTPAEVKEYNASKSALEQHYRKDNNAEEFVQLAINTELVNAEYMMTELLSKINPNIAEARKEALRNNGDYMGKIRDTMLGSDKFEKMFNEIKAHLKSEGIEYDKLSNLDKNEYIKTLLSSEAFLNKSPESKKLAKEYGEAVDSEFAKRAGTASNYEVKQGIPPELISKFLAANAPTREHLMRIGAHRPDLMFERGHFNQARLHFMMNNYMMRMRFVRMMLRHLYREPELKRMIENEVYSLKPEMKKKSREEVRRYINENRAELERSIGEKVLLQKDKNGKYTVNQSVVNQTEVNKIIEKMNNGEPTVREKIRVAMGAAVKSMLGLSDKKDPDTEELLGILKGRLENSSEFRKIVKDIVQPTMREQFQSHLDGNMESIITRVKTTIPEDSELCIAIFKRTNAATVSEINATKKTLNELKKKI